MDSMIGEIRMFGGNYAPEGWVMCNGSLLAITEYPALFSLLGTTWGGDGRLTFGVPDLRGRVPVGAGQGPNRTNRVVGQMGGAENVTLQDANLPAHNHPFNISNVAGTTGDLGPNVMYSLPGTAGDVMYLQASAAVFTPVTLNDDTVIPEGGNNSHTNVMPSMAITFIMCALYGMYPERNN